MSSNKIFIQTRSKVREYFQRVMDMNIIEALRLQREVYNQQHKKTVNNLKAKHKKKMSEVMEKVKLELNQNDEDFRKMEVEKDEALALCDHFETELSKKLDELEFLQKVSQDQFEDLSEKYKTAKLKIVKLQRDNRELEMTLERPGSLKTQHRSCSLCLESVVSMKRMLWSVVSSAVSFSSLVIMMTLFIKQTEQLLCVDHFQEMHSF